MTIYAHSSVQNMLIFLISYHIDQSDFDPKGEIKYSNISKLGNFILNFYIESLRFLGLPRP